MINDLFILVLLATNKPQIEANADVVLASHSISLENRYSNEYVNDVFKDNILLALNYTSGEVKSKQDINWGEIASPFHYQFELKPGEEFAFHKDVLPEFNINVVKTTNSQFNWADGYKSDGYLIGDGVCHLASLIYWSAKDAGLEAHAPVSHSFADIEGIPDEYGVSIFSTRPRENLYIINDKEKPVSFVFDYNGQDLSVSVKQQKSN